MLIDALADLGLPGAGRLRGYPGVWVGAAAEPAQDRRHRRARWRGAAPCTASPSTSTPTSSMFDHIVPCGIADKAVTSLAAEGVDVTDAREVVDAVVARARRALGDAGRSSARTSCGATAPHDLSAFSRGARRAAGERRAGAGAGARCSAGCAARRVDAAGEGPRHHRQRKPEWMRAKARPRRRATARPKRPMRDLGLVTVCEEAGCPNI